MSDKRQVPSETEYQEFFLYRPKYSRKALWITTNRAEMERFNEEFFEAFPASGPWDAARIVGARFGLPEGAVFFREVYDEVWSLASYLESPKKRILDFDCGKDIDANVNEEESKERSDKRITSASASASASKASAAERVSEVSEVSVASSEPAKASKAAADLRGQVWSFPLPELGVFEIMLPIGAQLLHVNEEFGKIRLYAYVDPANFPYARKFRLVVSGETIPERVVGYVGTVAACGERRPLHLFEVA